MPPFIHCAKITPELVGALAIKDKGGWGGLGATFRECDSQIILKKIGGHIHKSCPCLI
jgi:hypothetical protein